MSDIKISELTKLSKVDNSVIFPVSYGPESSLKSAKIGILDIYNYLISNYSLYFSEGSGIKLNFTNNKIEISSTGDNELFVFADSLPKDAISPNKIYIVPDKTNPIPGENEYVEYIYKDGKWELIGKAVPETDLSEYYRKSDIDSRLYSLSLTYITPAQTDDKIAAALAPYAESNYVNEELKKYIPTSEISKYWAKKDLYLDAETIHFAENSITVTPASSYNTLNSTVEDLAKKFTSFDNSLNSCITVSYFNEKLQEYATQTWVEGKKYLTEHQSLVDYATKEWANSTFLKEHQSLSNYYDSETIDSKFNSLSSTYQIVGNYATQAWVEAKKYLTEHQSLTDYATKEWVNTQGFLTEQVSLEGYATEDWVTSKKYIDENALKGYATEQWVENKRYLTEHQSLVDYALKSEVTSQIEGLSEKYQPIGNYATTSELTSQIEGLSSIYQPIGNYLTDASLESKLEDFKTELDELYQPKGESTPGEDVSELKQKVNDLTEQLNTANTTIQNLQKTINDINSKLLNYDTRFGYNSEGQFDISFLQIDE